MEALYVLLGILLLIWEQVSSFLSKVPGYVWVALIAVWVVMAELSGLRAALSDLANKVESLEERIDSLANEDSFDDDLDNDEGDGSP